MRVRSFADEIHTQESFHLLVWSLTSCFIGTERYNPRISLVFLKGGRGDGFPPDGFHQISGDAAHLAHPISVFHTAAWYHYLELRGCPAELSGVRWT